MPPEQARPAAGAAPAAGFARLTAALVAALEVYCAMLIVAMAAIVLVGVFYRYVVQRALPWYDEFAEFLLVWLTFYGSVLASHRGGHIGFEAVVEALPASLQRAAAIVAEVVVLFVQAALFYYGWTLVEAASLDTAVSIRAVRLSWIYSAIPISGGLMFLVGLTRLAGLRAPSRR
jgi:TRAP-type C4-dicarboxylate transport system permease small subunit